MSTDRKTHPKEVLKPCEFEIIRIQDEKQISNNLNIGDLGNLPLIDTPVF